MTERLYLDDSALLEFSARVLARREVEGRPAVLLDRSAFYAENGGQPCDTGTLGGVSVLAVLEKNGEILHVLDRPLEADEVHGVVDAARRRDHVQQHHGQHLLSRAFVELCAAETVAFHLGASRTTIDLDRRVTRTEARAVERRVNEVVWSARPVRVSVISPEAARAEGLKSPPGPARAVRIVDVEGFDRQPCGGTHPRSTAEVGVVLVEGLEAYKGGTRVAFVCGQRALDAVARRRDAVDQLVAVLSAPLDGLVAAARKAKEDLAASERQAKERLERALEGEAHRLLAHADGSPALVVATYDDWTPGDLRILASKLVALAPSVALLASRERPSSIAGSPSPSQPGKAHLVFAQSEGLPHDIPSLLARAVLTLGGHGGGRGNLAQGGGDPARLGEALADAFASVRR